jgi:hypothetical protein
MGGVNRITVNLLTNRPLGSGYGHCAVVSLKMMIDGRMRDVTAAKFPASSTESKIYTSLILGQSVQKAICLVLLAPW